MSKVINVTVLQRASVEYDPMLRLLPYNELMPRLRALGIRFISTDKKHVETSFERKGGIARPLVAGDTTPNYITALGKIKQSALEPEWGHTSLVEDIMNYEDVNVLSNSSERVDPVTKKHPQELLIIQTIVRTVGEDILDSYYHAERDDNGDSPLDLFDGINTLKDALIVAGEISAANGNYAQSNAIAAPQDAADYAAYTSIVDWLRGANQKLKNSAPVLKMTPICFQYAIDALANKLKYTGSRGWEMLQQYLSGDANISGLRLSVEDEMGSGTGMYLTLPDNFDFDLWTNPAVQFVQVRNPFENPNLVQYWSQFKAGARIRSWNKKMLYVNDDLNTANQLSGDYVS